MMGAFIGAVAAGLVAGLSAAAPWVIYASRIAPSLERAGARPLAYLVAVVPAVLASIATFARLYGWTTGSLRSDVILIGSAILLASSWPPIVRAALGVTGGASMGSSPAVRYAMRAVAIVLAVVLFVPTATWVVAPAYASLRACMDAEMILAEAETASPIAPPEDDPLPSAWPEAGAVFAFGFPLNLEQAADSRHDADTRRQLIEAGFVEGQYEVWNAVDGRGIQADVFVFRTAEGARAYQAAVTRHACQYANEAFRAPMGGIGLQVRYDDGDPIVEQISFVAGTRRYLVSVSELAVPSDHRRIIAIQDAVTAEWPS